MILNLHFRQLSTLHQSWKLPISLQAERLHEYIYCKTFWKIVENYSLSISALICNGFNFDMKSKISEKNHRKLELTKEVGINYFAKNWLLRGVRISNIYQRKNGKMLRVFKNFRKNTTTFSLSKWFLQLTIFRNQIRPS